MKCAGLDISSLTELQAVAFLSFDDDENAIGKPIHEVRMDWYCPNSTKIGSEFLAQKNVSVTPGETVSFSHILENSFRSPNTEQITVGFDPYDAIYFAQNLIPADYSVEPIRSGFLTMTAVCVFLQQLQTRKLLRFEDPFLAYQLSRLEFESDIRANLKPVRKANNAGVFALLRALAVRIKLFNRSSDDASIHLR